MSSSCRNQKLALPFCFVPSLHERTTDPSDHGNRCHYWHRLRSGESGVQKLEVVLYFSNNHMIHALRDSLWSATRRKVLFRIPSRHGQLWVLSYIDNQTLAKRLRVLSYTIIIVLGRGSWGRVIFIYIQRWMLHVYYVAILCSIELVTIHSKFQWCGFVDDLKGMMRCQPHSHMFQSTTQSEMVPPEMV